MSYSEDVPKTPDALSVPASADEDADGRRPPVARCVLAAALVLGALGAFAALWALAVHTAAGQRFENATIRHYSYGGPLPHRFFDLAWRSVGAGSLVALCICLRERVALLAGLIGAVTGAVVTTEALRHGFGRPELATTLLGRPDVAAFNRLYSASFPSGHAAGAMGVALALVYAQQSARARAIASVIGSVACPTMSVMLVALPSHRPSDVVGGFLIAFAWLVIAAFVAAVLGAPDPPPERAASCRARRVLATVVLAAAATYAAAIVYAARAGFSSAGYSRSFYVAIAGTAVAATGLVELFGIAITPRGQSAISEEAQCS
jgi:hypothetical protein